MPQTRSTCPYCGVGCGVLIDTSEGVITGVRGDPDHPANRGRLCSKGSSLHLSAQAELDTQVRLLHPLHRVTPGQAPQRLSWDEALERACARIDDAVRRRGPESVGFYVSGQLLTEDYYAFNKLARGLIQTPHIDSNSRLCMSSAVAAYKQSLGADAPPACYEDIDHARCILIAGANPAWAHPILFRRMESARQARPEQKWIVIDPRRTDTAASADLHLPLRPGSDLRLFQSLLHVMIWEGWVDRHFIERHTEGFEAAKAAVRDASPERVASECDLAPGAIAQAAQWFAQSGASLSLYCQGLNQSREGTAKNTALINLHLATGQIGRSGAGPLSLTGQPNAMGGREVGAMANLLAGHRDLADPSHRAEVARLWGVPSIPQGPGHTALELFEAAADGAIEVLWIACTNPAHSLPDQATIRQALRRTPFVVLQDAYRTTATADYAHLLLPASTWGEKDGTVTNSERCISRVRAAIAPPGEARPDWRIACDLGHRLARRWGRPIDMSARSAQALWEEHRASTIGRDLDIGGLSYARLDAHGPQQWPCADPHRPGLQRLYEDGRFPTPSGRARFVTRAYAGPAQARDAQFPIVLTTARLRDQWHGMSRTGLVPRLWAHAPEPAVEMHPQELSRRRLAAGEWVRVRSRQGALLLPLRASEDLGMGQAHLAMHWGSECLGGRTLEGVEAAGVNALTQRARCPDSRQPELKHTPVRVERLAPTWSLLAMAWMPDGLAQDRREALRALMPHFDAATCTLFGQGHAGVRLRAISDTPPPESVLTEVARLLGLRDGAGLRYLDPQQGHRRWLELDPDAPEPRLRAALLAGDTRAEAWIAPLLIQEQPVAQYGQRLLFPGPQAPGPTVQGSRTVCVCLGVREDAIRRSAAQVAGDIEARLAWVQSRLRCGTQCGSCLPELRRLVPTVPFEAVRTPVNAPAPI